MNKTGFFAILLLLLALIGCSGESGPTLNYSYPLPTDLKVSGIIDLSDVAVHKDLGGILPSIVDLTPFSLSVQDNPALSASADGQGRFVFSAMSIRDQLVIFCRHSQYDNFVLEWMAASSGGLYGDLSATITIRSTAQSMIARCLRERYGRRIRPEELKLEHINTTVDAIASVLEKHPEKLATQSLDQVPEVKAAYTAMADALHNGNSGAYPNNFVLMLYMGGDNSLSSYIAANIDDIADAGLPSGTQILIQADFPIDGMKRLMISGKKVVELAAVGHVDSTSGAVIADFVAWSRRVFPAARYALVISSHADAWKNSSSMRGTLITDNSADKTGDPVEIAAYIQGALQTFEGYHRPLDLLVFDACSMATIEVALQFRNCAAYTVFSQAFVPASGFPYGSIVSAIAAKGVEKLDSRAIGTLICDEYRKKYIDAAIRLPATVSMVNNSAFASFMPVLNKYFAAIHAEKDLLATVLANLRDSLEVVSEEGDKKYVVQAFEKAEYRDLRSLVENAENPMPSIKIESEDLLDEFAGLIAVNYRSAVAFPGATGLSITLPDAKTYATEYVGSSPSKYFQLEFCQTTIWEDLLAAICAD